MTRLCPRWSPVLRLRCGRRVVLLALTLAVASWPGMPVAGSVEIITSPDRADIALERPLLRAIFTLRMREWPDGRPVRVFVLPDNHELHDRFSREELGTYPYVLRGVWDRVLYTGTGFAPIVVRTEDEMRRLVSSTPGAIGYVDRAAGAENRSRAP